MSVLDASAVLAFLNDEPGSSVVESALDSGAVISAANWSEVAQKVTAAGSDWIESSALLDNYDVAIEVVGRADAESAAAMWHPGAGLSLADRLCITLGRRLERRTLTCDSAWGEEGLIVQIR